MRVLGIDCAVARTGYGVLEEKSGRSPSLVACGVIVTSAKDAFPQRLRRIYHRIQKVVEEFAPDQVALEDIFYHRNFRTAVKLGHVRAVAMLAAAEAGCPVAEYSPLEVKSGMVGYGRAEKHQVQSMVKNVLGLAEVPQSHDAADALAVAWCHLNTLVTRTRMGLPSDGERRAGKARRPVSTGNRL